MKKISTQLSITIVAVILLSILSCKKRQSCSYWDVPPPPSFVFVIQEDGMKLEDSMLNKIKSYYYNGSSKVNVNLYYDPTNDFLKGTGALSDDRKMILAAGDNGIKDFYIEFPDGSTDTVYLEIEKVETCQAKLEKCYCHYPIRNVKYNNKKVTEHELSWVEMFPIYIFNH